MGIAIDNIFVPSVSIIIPTFNESGNIKLIAEQIALNIGDIKWEIIFVDDNSPDNTWHEVINLVKIYGNRVRILRRITRRGLSSACIEGILSSSADIIIIMDADLQHDPKTIPHLINSIVDQGADIAIATRYEKNGSVGEWNKIRHSLSLWATYISKTMCGIKVSDPMSGFFAMRRKIIDKSAEKLSNIGFKILFDILLTIRKQNYKIIEIPYVFGKRIKGESKLNAGTAWDFMLLILDKYFGKMMPARFISFAIIGAFGVIIHFLILTVFYKFFKTSFQTAHTFGTFFAIISNFTINNILTYSDRKLKGWNWFKGLIAFIALCSLGAVTNIGIGEFLFEQNSRWQFAAIIGIAAGALWNYAVSAKYIWRS